jgi:hypothetical protein
VINEQRVAMMTKMAAYENGEGKKNIKISRYFRSDYILVQIFKSIVFGTIAFAICFALYFVRGMEEFVKNLYNIDLIAYAMDILVAYLVFLVSYLLITYLISAVRYARAKKSLKHYFVDLKKLGTSYESDRRTR